MSFLICREDYIDEATRTVSSEDGQFPASNLYDQGLRDYVWRSAGYFNVTTANRTIIFQESVGVNLTATIAVAEYDNITDFMEAVRVSFATAGTSDYLVTQDPDTKKLIIAASLSGGATIFSIMWSHASTTAEDLLGFSNAGDDTGALTYTADYVRIHTEEFLKWDLGASSSPDIFIAIGKKISAIKLTDDAVIKLQGNLTDSWTSPAYDQTLTYDELAIMDLKTSGDDGLHTTALRYWRLHIIDKANPNGYIELSKVYLGEYYQTTQGVPQFELQKSKIDFSTKVQFQSGSSSSTRRSRTEAFGVDWFDLSNTEAEVFDEIGLDLGESKPFFCVMDPNVVYSSSINYMTRYVKFSAPLSTSLILAGKWTSSWQLEEEV